MTFSRILNRKSLLMVSFGKYGDRNIKAQLTPNPKRKKKGIIVSDVLRIKENSLFTMLKDATWKKMNVSFIAQSCVGNYCPR